MAEAKISSKGQLVIPKYLRDALGMQAGKSVILTKVGRQIILTPKYDDPVEGLVNAGKEISMKNIRRQIKGE